MSLYPENKLTIIGAGIIGYLEAYYAWLRANQKSEKIKVTIHEKNKSLKDTTTAHLVPSLTPDEILSVVPRGQTLIEKLKSLFSEPGGIRVDDVENVNDTEVARKFKEAVAEYGKDEEGHRLRTEQLLTLGKKSMELWQALYDNGDEELKQILKESNFNPCREPSLENKALHDGYRIDLIYNVPDAQKKAEGMLADYTQLGYKYCAVLSPSEVAKLDPYLADFCEANSEKNGWDEERQWKNNAVAIWRPGGCIDTQTFLPKFHAYLEKKMGKYTNEEGKEKNCFKVEYERKITGVTYEDNSKKINGLRFLSYAAAKSDKHTYQKSNYAFCPGEAVGTLKSLGFQEPDYARFAGASLMLNIKLTPEQKEKFAQFNHCMEVHQEGVVLAWQARLKGDMLFIGVAGTKAFYADQAPNTEQAFSKDRNLLQLNMINDVLPDCISIALGRDTKGQKLTQEDLGKLESLGIAQRWVGTRAVAYDGFPTVGSIRTQDGEMVINAHATTHLGSGGVSFAPAAVTTSQAFQDTDSDDLTKDIISSGRSYRRA